MIEYYISSVRCFDLFLIKRKFIGFNFFCWKTSSLEKKVDNPIKKTWFFIEAELC